MKKQIHPEYFEQAKITCACGKVYEVGSTTNDIQVELCAACHPFYTGTQKILDTARRVEKFEERKKQAAAVVQATGKKIKRAKREAQKEKKAKIAEQK